MLPFKSKEDCASQKSQLRTLSQTSLANLTANHSVGDATVAWIYSLNLQLSGAIDLNLRLEVLKTLGKIACDFDPDQISYASDEFTRLLNAVATIRLSAQLAAIKASIFYQLAGVVGRKARGALTLPHIYLAGALEPSMQRFSQPIAATFLDFDPRFGQLKYASLHEFFTKTSNLLAAWRCWDLASLHSKCAVAVSDPVKNPRLTVKAILLHLIEFRNTSNILPGIMFGEPDIRTSPPMQLLLQQFDEAHSLRLDPQFKETVTTICTEYNLETLVEPLLDALRISWLESLHRVMPKCLRTQVEQCGQFDMALLDRGYNATVSYTNDKQQVFEFTKSVADPWETLENVLVVTRRLTQTNADSSSAGSAGSAGNAGI